MVTERNTGSKSAGFRRNYDGYLKDFGVNVTVTRNTETKDSMNRLTDNSPSTFIIQVDIQWITKKDLDHVNLGSVKIGDGMMFVKYNADIQLEDEITYNSVQWRVVSQIEGEQVGGDIIYKGYIIRKNAQS